MRHWVSYNYVLAIKFACFRKYAMAIDIGCISAPHAQRLILNGDAPVGRQVDDDEANGDFIGRDAI